MSDTGGNTGIWSFTLTVTASVSPQTAVVPVNPQAPTGLEILVPFQIDPTIGGVQTLQDYSAIIAQHIATALMTSAFERVMLPAYGIGLRNSVFKNFANGVPSPLQSDITKGLAALVPEASINSVQVQPDPTNANVLVVTVEFSVVPYSGTNTVTVAVGGPISQVSAS
jgi:phage baseplate assembly protein W